MIWITTAGDVHPPLYCVILHYWMQVFGRSVLSVRGLTLALSTKRVWWVNGKAQGEGRKDFPQGWKQTHTIDVGGVEVR